MQQPCAGDRHNPAATYSPQLLQACHCCGTAQAHQRDRPRNWQTPAGSAQRRQLPGPASFCSLRSAHVPAPQTGNKIVGKAERCKHWRHAMPVQEEHICTLALGQSRSSLACLNISAAQVWADLQVVSYLGKGLADLRHVCIQLLEVRLCLVHATFQHFNVKLQATVWCRSANLVGYEQLCAVAWRHKS